MNLNFLEYSNFHNKNYVCTYGGASGKEPACQYMRPNEMWVQSLGREDPLEKEMATHSSILAWKSHGGL